MWGNHDEGPTFLGALGIESPFSFSLHVEACGIVWIILFRDIGC